MRVTVAPYNNVSVLPNTYNKFLETFTSQQSTSDEHKQETKGQSVSERRATTAKKVQFVVILLVCLVLAIYQTAKCAMLYAASETGTGDTYVHLTTTSFPVMTVCPTYPYKLDKLQKHGIATLTDIQFNAKWVSNDSNVTPVKFYEDVVIRPEEVIRHFSIFAQVAVEGRNQLELGPDDTICGGERLYSTDPYYFNGDCFPIEMPKCLREAGVLELDIDFYHHTDIFIHHPGQFLSPNSRSRVDVDVGHFVKIAVNHEVVQLLGHDGSCVDDFGADQDFDHCMYSRLREINMKAVNCTVPWLKDKSNICTDPAKSAKAFELYQNNRRNQFDICPSSCKFTNMYFGPPVTGLQNAEQSGVARAVFYFRRDIKLTTEYYLYSVLSMLAEMGGYVAMFLGASLFDVVDLISSLIDLFSRSKAKKLEGKKNITKNGQLQIAGKYNE